MTLPLICSRSGASKAQKNQVFGQHALTAPTHQPLAVERAAE